MKIKTSVKAGAKVAPEQHPPIIVVLVRDLIRLIAGGGAPGKVMA